MNEGRSGSHLIAFGDTPAERYEVIKSVAESAHRDRKVGHGLWRSKLSRRVAQRCSVATSVVYSFIDSLDDVQIAELRKLCIGEAGESALSDRMDRRRASNEKSERKTRSDAGVIVRRADTALHDRVAEEYRKAIAALPPESRTRQRLAQAMGRQQYVVDGYLFAHRELADLLSDGKVLFERR